MKIIKSVTIAAIAASLILVNTYSNAQDSKPSYLVKYVDKGVIKIDGTISTDEWQDFTSIQKEFSIQSSTEKTPYTHFKAAWNEDGLYFAFDIKDQHIVLADTKSGERAVDDSDRAEIFLSPLTDGPTLEQYYCLEMAPNNIVHEFSAQTYRQMDTSWALKGSVYETVISDTGYTVEGFLPTETLTEMDIHIKDGGSFYAGVFRAEFTQTEDELVMQWISWINAKLSKPDFHGPTSFGLFNLVK
ncbi:MAG: carbohydrate-binding family 9-like protein [Kordiimonadaceae bacterium]|jgi:hypothetical protein|nr:carbohydrate-binding family 9-like protein [Kordiimonadaceae bacterium]MBT6031519.1 carbohydrate-binding family 9-like protein [Kordiimonadaceae bacterium]